MGSTGRKDRQAFETGVARNLEREFSRLRVFYFFCCNPLKSPDSAKEIQVNASNFAWH